MQKNTLYLTASLTALLNTAVFIITVSWSKASKQWPMTGTLLCLLFKASVPRSTVWANCAVLQCQFPKYTQKQAQLHYPLYTVSLIIVDNT